MVAATATPEFDQCWADFNEVAIVALGVGVDSASYESVEPPDVELGGDSSSLQALEGTLTFGSTTVPDTCVCAFVQQGRTVVAFHSAAPIFTSATRRDVIAAALARVDETVVLLSGFNRESTGLLDTPAILIALRDQSLLQGVRP